MQTNKKFRRGMLLTGCFVCPDAAKNKNGLGGNTASRISALAIYRQLKARAITRKITAILFLFFLNE
jgi:hypothetical protein